ncbi:MAG TPA: VanZ family protein [Caproiciproducens sp.]|nr:VanZ family protein [Caproiciproducens sp.]
MSNKLFHQGLFFIVLTAGFMLFIFHNSMFSIQQSDRQSGTVLKALNQLFAAMGYDVMLTQYSVRKLAHFTEYFIFGMIMTIMFRVCSIDIKENFFFLLFLFLAIPVTDEYIQTFYPGRNSSALDIIIDFAGCAAGMGLCRLLFYVLDSDTKQKR